MTEAFITEYFTGLARKHKLILHTTAEQAFFRIRSRYDLDEFDNAVRSMTKDACMLLEIGAGSFGSWDSPADSVNIGVHILIKTDELYANQEAARETAKQILKSILTRIAFDRLDADQRTDGQPGPLKAAQIKFDNAGKYDDMAADEHWFGKSLYIDFRADEDFIYNPNDYNA